MRQLTDSEMIALRELLQAETTGLAKAQAIRAMITDDELGKLADAAVMACKNRIFNIQQFIDENNVIPDMTVGGVE
jgi:hypothetical protein